MGKFRHSDEYLIERFPDCTVFEVGSQAALAGVAATTWWGKIKRRELPWVHAVVDWSTHRIDAVATHPDSVIAWRTAQEEERQKRARENNTNGFIRWKVTSSGSPNF